MSVSDVFLIAEFKHVSRSSLSPTPFAPGQRAATFCVRTLRCVFTVGAMKNSRISFPRQIVVFCNDICTVMEFLGHEFNPD